MIGGTEVSGSTSIGRFARQNAPTVTSTATSQNGSTKLLGKQPIWPSYGGMQI